jgi:hypothetical protein
MTEQTHSSINKKKSGCKLDEVWEFFEQTKLKSPGHFSAVCKFCHKKWPRAYVNELQAHLSNNCNKCPTEIQQYWLGFVAAKDIIDSDNATSIHPTKSKKRKAQNQPGIEDFYESRDLPESKVVSINKALVRAFVNCGISFSIIDNPFFRELLYQLRPNYEPPDRKVLAGRFLNQESARVSQAISKELEHSENLTLGNLMLQFTFFIVTLAYRYYFFHYFGWLDERKCYFCIQLYSSNAFASSISLLSSGLFFFSPYW